MLLLFYYKRRWTPTYKLLIYPKVTKEDFKIQAIIDSNQFYVLKKTYTDRMHVENGKSWMAAYLVQGIFRVFVLSCQKDKDLYQENNSITVCL